MTAVSTFRAQLDTALNTIKTGLPNARVFVAGIPNVYQLWNVLKGNGTAIYHPTQIFALEKNTQLANQICSYNAVFKSGIFFLVLVGFVPDFGDLYFQPGSQF